MEIKEMEENDRPAWDLYIRSSNHGLPFQLSGWRDILGSAYGYEAHYIMAVESGRVTGALPLLIIRSALVGSRATTVQGGLCADDPETAAALIEQGKAAAGKAGVKCLVLQDTRQAWSSDLVTTSRHVHWITEIDSKGSSLMQTLPRVVHREVKKAHKNGLEVLVDYSAEHLDDLYEVLSRFSHQAGSPIFGRSFLDSVTHTFPNEYHYVLIYREKRPLGGYFLLDLGDTSHGIWGASLPESLPLGTAYLAYWSILSDAVDKGFHYLDLGRSPTDSNSSTFKSRWGGVSEPVFQQIASLGANHRGQSITNQIHTRGKYRLFMKTWSWLPFPVAQYLGPKLRKHVPFA